MIPKLNMDARLKAPPVNMFSSPANPPPSSLAAASACESMPGSTTYEPMRKTNNNARVVRMRLRNSSMLQIFLRVWIKLFMPFSGTLDFYDFTAFGFYGRFGGGGKCVCRHFYFGRELTPTQDLDSVVLGREPVCLKNFRIESVQVFLFRQSFDHVEVDGFVLHAVRVGESEFRYPTLQRHLTAFETALALVPATRLCAFVSTAGGIAGSRPFTATDSLSVFYGPFGRL